MTEQAVFSPGESKNDWSIIRALSEVVGKKLNYNNLDELRKELFEEFPTFVELNDYKYNPKPKISDKKNTNFGTLKNLKKNFFMTCPISRSSKTMAECTKQFESFN